MIRSFIPLKDSFMNSSKDFFENSYKYYIGFFSSRIISRIPGRFTSGTSPYISRVYFRNSSKTFKIISLKTYSGIPPSVAPKIYPKLQSYLRSSFENSAKDCFSDSFKYFFRTNYFFRNHSNMLAKTSLKIPLKIKELQTKFHQIFSPGFRQEFLQRCIQEFSKKNQKIQLVSGFLLKMF